MRHVKRICVFAMLFTVLLTTAACGGNSYTKLQKKYLNSAREFVMEAPGIEPQTFFRFDDFFWDYVCGHMEPEGNALQYVTNFSENYEDYTFDKTEYQYFRLLKSWESPWAEHQAFYGVRGVILPTGEKAYQYTAFDQEDSGDDDYNQPRRPSYNLPVIYSSKGLSYKDFAEIVPGVTIEDVLSVDPTVSIKKAGIEWSLNYHIENGLPDEFSSGSWHLVDEGLLCIEYYVTTESITVTGLQLHQDYWPLSTTNFGYAAPFCIDPADRPPRVDPPPTGEAPPDMVFVSREQQ
ncbi:MAG: hypothetical protein IKL89_06965 [Clostridia bacterium]|nr:hypothetical protein [Clostridia bacterium]